MSVWLCVSAGVCVCVCLVAPLANSALDPAVEKRSAERGSSERGIGQSAETRADQYAYRNRLGINQPIGAAQGTVDTRESGILQVKKTKTKKDIPLTRKRSKSNNTRRVQYSS